MKELWNVIQLWHMLSPRYLVLRQSILLTELPAEVLPVGLNVILLNLVVKTVGTMSFPQKLDNVLRLSVAYAYGENSL